MVFFGEGRRRDVEQWRELTADRHGDYRAAVEPARGRVAAVCVTSRPQFLERALEQVAHQHHGDLELVVVTNSAAYDHVDVDAMVGRTCDRLAATVLRRSHEVSLGQCLNAAMATTNARFVAKIDDDDLYGPHYIDDALRAHNYAGAGVVGKHTYWARLEATDDYVLRFPGHEFVYSGTLAGGTLVIDRDRTGDLAFPDLSLGEDRAFIGACHRRGLSTFSADRFNFVQSRAVDNTWSVSREQFVARSLVVAAAQLDEVIDR